MGPTCQFVLQSQEKKQIKIFYTKEKKKMSETMALLAFLWLGHCVNHVFMLRTKKLLIIFKALI